MVVMVHSTDTSTASLKTHSRLDKLENVLLAGGNTDNARPLNEKAH